MNIRLREFLSYDYKDPAAWLRALAEMNPVVAASGLPYNVRTLRTHKLRRWNEVRQAALFAYGISQRLPDCRVDFAHAQASDYDAVVRWQRADEQYFTPVQLKELVPSRLNPQARLDAIIAPLSRYRDSSDLVVAVHLNRRFRLEEISRPSLNLGGLYFFGATVPNQSRWFLAGDLLADEAAITSFKYPA